MWQTSAASNLTQGEERNRNARRPIAPEPSAFRPGRGQVTGPRTGLGPTGEGREDSVGVDGVDAVVSRAGVAEVWRCLGSRYRRPPRVEAKVKEDALGHGVIGDEGDDLEPADAGDEEGAWRTSRRRREGPQKKLGPGTLRSRGLWCGGVYGT